LTAYYQREAEGFPAWARTTFNVARRVGLNIARLENYRIFPLSFIGREIELKGARLLDAGCGTGHMAIACALQGADVTGVDLDRMALDIARERARLEHARLEILEADVTQMKFSDATFDIVVSFQVLEHIPRALQAKVLQEMWRLLRPGGVLFIQTPNRWFPVDVHDTQLPLAHWLPSRLGFAYARAFGRVPPQVWQMSWRDISRDLKIDFRGKNILNRCDMYHDLADFRAGHVAYTIDQTLRSKLYFAAVGPLYHLSRMINVPYAAMAPNLNLILRK
jgi:2-polyprenyl-3-methyl-5-hydroxy-6-metoxy-1,4-benzoquinol methylase